jgi:hypothetical protein
VRISHRYRVAGWKSWRDCVLQSQPTAIIPFKNGNCSYQLHSQNILQHVSSAQSTVGFTYPPTCCSHVAGLGTTGRLSLVVSSRGRCDQGFEVTLKEKIDTVATQVALLQSLRPLATLPLILFTSCFPSSYHSIRTQLAKPSVQRLAVFPLLR